MSKVIKGRLVTDVDVLHRTSTPVDLKDKVEVETIKQYLLTTFRERECKLQGLAAIQIGIAKRAILLRFNKGSEPVVVYNPVVLMKLGSKKSNEGCLSEGKTRFIVKRPLLAKVRYYSEDGKEYTEWLPYHQARIFCHECDHLDGILLQDKGQRV